MPSPSSCVSTNLKGETPAFAIYSKRPIELSKQLLTLVEKTQFFYLVKEFAHSELVQDSKFETLYSFFFFFEYFRIPKMT